MHDSQPQISRVDELKASPGQGQNSPTQPSQQDRAALKRAEQRRAEQERRRREAVSEEKERKKEEKELVLYNLNCIFNSFLTFLSHLCNPWLISCVISTACRPNRHEHAERSHGCLRGDSVGNGPDGCVVLHKNEFQIITQPFYKIIPLVA